MTVVLDTNVLVQAMDGGHPFSRIIDAWIDGRFSWAVSTDVLMEYEEVITRMLGRDRWRKFVQLMDLVDAADGTLVRVATFFRFGVIVSDRDDDKFVDCAIAVHADFILTDDRHFRLLADAGYKAQPLSPLEFIKRYLDGTAPL